MTSRELRLPRSSWPQAAASSLLPLLFYIAISLAYFATAGSWTQRFFGIGGDPYTYIWCINWWSFAIGNGLNPFITEYLWFPHGYNLAWQMASVPLASLLAWPITALGGPVLSFNVLSLLAPAAGAWTAFLLGRYLTRDWLASLFAGYLFGFSSYELGHLLGHLNLDVTFPVPLAVLLCVARVRRDIGRLRFVAALALVLLAELCLSMEVILTLCLLGAMAWVVFLACAPSSDRPDFWRLAADVFLAGIGTTIVAAPLLFYLIKGLGDVPDEVRSATVFSADLLNYLVPTMVTRFGRSIFAPIALRFTGNAAEQGAYLGLPLILLAAFYFRDNLGRPYGRALLITTALLVVLSLGPWLQVDGVRTTVPLPWLTAVKLPILRNALPARFTMYVALCISVVTALWLATREAGAWRPWRFVLAGVACLSLVPNLSIKHWNRWPSEPFFTGQHVRAALGPKPNVIILPFDLAAYQLPALAWQLDSNMAFTQSGGSLTFVPEREQRWTVLTTLVSGQVGPTFARDFVAYCAAHRVNFILIGPGTLPSLIKAIAALGWPEHMDGVVRVVSVPALSGLN